MDVLSLGARPQLQELIRLSLRLGSDLRLVQGAGGNLSVKEDGVLWIKASGTRLGEAGTREIFVPMAEGATREAVLVTEDLTPFVLADAAPAGLRPSIETALHALLPHRVVAHVHGVGSIAAGLTDRVDSAPAPSDDVDTVVIPYAKPGVQLARAVLDATRDRLEPTRPLALVLRNHGVVVGADSSEAAGLLLDQLEESFRSGPAPVLAPASAGGPLCPSGTVDDAAADVLCAGALTPDSTVFLGPQPFARIPAGPAPADHPTSRAFVADDGSVWLDPDLGADEREIAISLVDVARQVRGEGVQSLSPAHVNELLNWEAEAWRRALKR